MIYVTPLPFNASEMSWDQVQAHLRGIGNSCHLGIHTGALHSQISAISRSRLQLPSVEDIANYIVSSVKNFVSNNSLWNLLINLGIIGVLIILLLSFFNLGHPQTLRICFACCLERNPHTVFIK